MAGTHIFASHTCLRRAAIGASLAAYAIISLSVSQPARAESPSDDYLAQKEYNICIRMANQSPEEAFERALAWEDGGGGNGALHCQAIALTRLGHFEEAADRFERLARAMPDKTPPGVIADILAHAGISWFNAGQFDRARAIQTGALSLSPRNPDIRADRAVTLFQGDYFWEAIDDLNTALEVAPNRPDLLALRASAYRHVDALDLAIGDANAALRLSPTHPEALLERGILRRLAGNNDGARQDWLRLIDIHDGRPVAETARRNLELLDLQLDG